MLKTTGISFVALAAGQQVGKQKADLHLPLQIEQCTARGSCSPESAKVTMDANWRWLHKVGTSTNCYTGNEWDASICPDPTTCASNCGLDGIPAADWSGTYGVSSSGSDLSLNFVTHGQYSTNIGSRTYLMDTDSTYKLFKLKNKEFTFDVDVSKLPCGLNGALYFVEMAADGGMGKNGNKAGAAYGTGYCDAQCPHDIKFIDGEANTLDWKPSSTDKNAGTGKYGSCCHEMDIWESNTEATAVTPHICDVDGPNRCDGIHCGDNDAGERFKGWCDKNGCDLNPYRGGAKTFFGAGSNFDVDSTKPMTVVTQFLTSDGTDNGDLTEIRRVYVQDGKVIQQPNATLAGKSFDSITDDFCKAKTEAWADDDSFESKGGLKKMGDALERGMTLVMSLWDDHSVDMLWLDSTYPLNATASTPGAARGPCSTDSGKPDDVEKNHADAAVKYYNIKYGAIGSTYPSGPAPGPAPGPSPPAPSPAPGPAPSGCPGGSLQACIGLCPSNPPAAYKDCIEECTARCK